MDDAPTLQNQSALKQLTRTIKLSQGEFSLVLACCSYEKVRTQIIYQLHIDCPIPIRELTLDPTTKTLYTTITEAVRQDYPQALMVLGLETIVDLESLLTATKLIGEEFYDFPFPLIVWVTDAVLHKMIRLAPDFHNRATSVQFKVSTADLIQLIQTTVDAIFAEVLKSRENIFLDNITLGLAQGSPHCIELLAACKEIENRGIKLSLELSAGLEFVLGRTSDNTQKSAREYYERSLKLWQQVGNQGRQGHLLFYLGLWWLNYAVQHYAERQVAGNKAKEYFRKSIQAFKAANQPKCAAKFINFLCEALHRLEEWDELEVEAKNALKLLQNHPDLFRQARTYGFLAEVELARSSPSKAKILAQNALMALSVAEKMFLDPSPQEQAFLDWEQSFHQGWYLFSLGKAQYLLGQTQSAIETLEEAKETTKPYYDPLLYIGILKHLGEAFYGQKNYLAAFESKRESQVVESQFGLRTFVGAARLRPRQQVKNPALPQASSSGTIAKEILASRRINDLNCLLLRIKRDDYKLIIIHGQSGVGKSSILQAGLVPALREQPIDTRNVLPVLQRVYTNWVKELGVRLKQALKDVQLGLISDPLNSVENLLKQLRKNSENNLLTVLIFDQFEELFFDCLKPEHRKLFYDFLKQCLDIPYVKVVLTLREDYLHFLLECNDRLVNLDIINNNILDQKILYYLGNFNPEEAKDLIRALTSDTAFQLEDKLISRLVEDLSEELGEVRPIELQVVGAQLQAERITTLSRYQRLVRDLDRQSHQNSSSILLLPFQELFGNLSKTFSRTLSKILPSNLNKNFNFKLEKDPNFNESLKPKFVLVNRYLEDVIKNCGKENQQVAEVVLYLLTDEKKNRPIKTSVDLDRELKVLAESPETKLETLDLILDIFVKSGVVTLLKQVPSPRYQLVHDYLVTVIRQRQGDKILRDLREFRQRQDRLQKRITYGALFFSLAMAALAGFAGLQWQYVKESKRQTNLAKLNANYQLLQQIEDDQLSAFVTILRASKQLQNQNIDTGSEEETRNHLWRAVHFTPERNRLKYHRASVTSVSASSDGKLIASASADATVKVWNIDGSPYTDSAGEPMILEHDDIVRCVSFSPDQNPENLVIASAGKDKKIRLWNLRESNPIWISPEHDDEVRWVSFSPNGQMIASASADKTVRLWDGDHSNKKLITTLIGHTDIVYGVSFSPDGRMIASASKDKTVKLWTLEGKLLNSLTAHQGGVNSVNFSPDGQTLASSSDDGTVKLWQLNGDLSKIIPPKTIGIGNIKANGKAQMTQVNSVVFNATGTRIATASNDGQIRIWTKDGRFILALSGHRAIVNQVKFIPRTSQQQVNQQQINQQQVNQQQKNEMLVSAGVDKSVRLWSLDTALSTVVVQPGYIVSGKGATFSPNGNLIASTSTVENNIISLWNPEKVTEHSELPGQTEWVNSISFSSDGQVIASGLEDGTIKLWKQNGKPIRTLRGHKAAITKVLFSPGKTDSEFSSKTNSEQGSITSSNILAAASKDGTVKLWTVEGKLLTMIPHKSPVVDVDFSQDGQTLVSASNSPNGENILLVWRRDGTRIAKLESDERFSSVSFNPQDNTLIATAMADYSIKFWRIVGTQLEEKVQLSPTIGQHKGVIYKISFSPDGELLASASADGTIKIWDKKGVFLATLHEGSDLIEWVGFNSKGELAAIDSANQVRIWKDLTRFKREEIESVDKLIETACQQIGDYLKYNVRNNGNPKSEDQNLCQKMKDNPWPWN
ncbi:MAG: hypothetical protein ACRC8A_19985 [Microcoleaceae cyanobacterium]